jgi:hypothetical protein
LNYFGWTQEFAKQQARFDRLEKLLGNGFSRKQFTVLNDEQNKKDRRIESGDSFYRLTILLFRKGLYSSYPSILSEFGPSIMNDYNGIISTRYRIEAFERLFEVVFALEFYRHDHSQYPASLAELTGKYIKTIPSDPYTDGELFRYRLELQPNTNAGYLLYSVGENGEDDNGVYGYNYCNETQEPSTNNKTNNNNTTNQKQPDKPKKSGDDIRIRMLYNEPLNTVTS